MYGVSRVERFNNWEAHEDKVCRHSALGRVVGFMSGRTQRMKSDEGDIF
jgi:hypothetical protein